MLVGAITLIMIALLCSGLLTLDGILQIDGGLLGEIPEVPPASGQVEVLPFSSFEGGRGEGVRVSFNFKDFTQVLQRVFLAF